MQASPGFRLYNQWSIRLELAHQAAAAVEFMHSHNVVHRDLTSNNLLVTDKWEAKVGLGYPLFMLSSQVVVNEVCRIVAMHSLNQ